MQTLLTKSSAALKKFNADEAGNETIQTVMIVALSAIILIAIKKIWESTESGVTGLLDELFGLVF